MSEELSVRRACEEDLDKVLRLYALFNPDDPQAPAERIRDVWHSILARSGMTLLVGVYDRQIVSSCVLIVVPNLTRRCRPFAMIENVITHPDFRRRGFGTAVLKEAVRIAKEDGCYKIVLSTASTNEGTWSFYERAGFKRGTRTTFEIRNL